MQITYSFVGKVIRQKKHITVSLSTKFFLIYNKNRRDCRQALEGLMTLVYMSVIAFVYRTNKSHTKSILNAKCLLETP